MTDISWDYGVEGLPWIDAVLLLRLQSKDSKWIDGELHLYVIGLVEGFMTKHTALIPNS